MNLFKTALFATVCVVAASTPSLAAKAAGGWGGAYAGLSVGYLQDRGDLIDVGGENTCTGCNAPGDSANDTTFGAQAGYNWQEGRTVYGFEADANGVYGESKQGFDGTDLYMAQTINGSYSLRGRIGITMENDYLLYGTAGVALLETTSYSHSNGSDRDGMSRLFSGWTAGAGVEKKINSTYSAKFEGRWSDFSAKEWTDSADDAYGADPENFSLSAGVNYHF
jgi:outer membrane immunogenic protein